ncbi:S-layer homology domain-containing protein [uncultured Oscillibacter sp.]|uniref:S-layer homology domain-containing protein n=1 Tax=uncultured Oscillibacter sp. TaxID=876091 RepID=UPI0025F2268D|nr:S-layer homology domain-containing protein [uncultured Oscillibacter sp.]
MKKRIASLVMALALCLTLLPTPALAAATRLKHVDIVFDMPKAGEENGIEVPVSVKSIKSGNVDLMAQGATVQYTEWEGDNVIIDTPELYQEQFRAGTTYLVTVKLAFDTGKGYCANYQTVSGGYLVTADSFSATINGVPATVRSSAPYFPTLQVSLTIPGERYTAEEKAELNADLERKTDLLAQAKRALATPRTQAQASAQQFENFVTGVTTMTDPYHVLENTDSIRALILDTDKKVTEDTCFFIGYAPYLKELWLSDKVDPYQFIAAMDSYLWLPIAGVYRWEKQSDLPFYTAETTVFIPESAAPALRAAQAERGYKIPYTIKTYSGSDVYAAQKAGAAAAKDNWCTAHKYNLQIRTADRVYTYAQACQYARRYYWSCAICGKCEYNANHVAPHAWDTELELKQEKLAHSDNGEYPTAEAYIGVNAAGEHVYWLSCEYCGHSYRYLQQHLTSRDVDASGTGMSLKRYQEEANATLKWEESQALNTTELYPGTFTLAQKSTAKTSTWSQGDVNLALNDNLLDPALLGSDYTKPISRLQFCSVAVRLAEELTGKTITPAPAGTFTDTDNAYALKAYAAGITAGNTATTFGPDGILNRQQMATFLRRTLQYVEKNSNYKYTSYTSKLASYSDYGQVKSYAREPMAFMNALDLVKGTSATTLSPNRQCTIEQAVVVAERSVYAHQIGWYQATPVTNIYNYNSSTGEHEREAGAYTSFDDTNASLHPGDLVWVTGKLTGVSSLLATDSSATAEDCIYSAYIPGINPYTKQSMYLKYRDLTPVRG